MLPALDFDSSLTMAVEATKSKSDNRKMITTSSTTAAAPSDASNLSQNAGSSSQFTTVQSTTPTPFQESKNFWKKNIAAHQSRHVTTGDVPHTPTKRSHIGCTKRPLSTDSTQSTGTECSDVHGQLGPVSHLFCRPSSLPVWPQLRQTRQRHSTPTLRSSYQRSPKRKLATRYPVTSEVSASPKRSAMPRRVQSRGMLPFLRSFEDTQQASEDLVGVKENAIMVKMEVEVYKEMAQPGEYPTLERNHNMWNDPGTQHNFTSTWRDHQDGNTTEDAYLGKLTFEGSEAHLTPDPAKRGTLMRAIDLNIDQSLVPTNSLPEERPQATTAVPPIPPTRRSSKDKGIHEARPLHMTRIRSRNELQGINEDQALEVVEDRKPDNPSQFVKIARPKPTKTTTSILMLPNSNVMLKNTRSCESITQIEAMIPSSSKDQVEATSQPRSPHRRSPKQSRRPSKTMQPAGDPPERPLPKLPIDNDATRKQCRLSNESSTRVESRGLKVNDIGSSPASVSTIEASSPRTPTDDRTSSNTLNGKADGLCINVPKNSEYGNGAISISGADPFDLSGNESPTGRIRTRSKKKKVLADRTERVRELKKKHMAATNTIRAAVEKRKSEETTAPYDEQSRCEYQISRSTQTTEPSVGAIDILPPPPPPLPQLAKYRTSFGSPSSKRNTVDELDQFPPVPLSRPGSRASVAATTQSGRGITRTNSTPKKSRSRGRTIQGRHSLNQDSKHSGRQPLSHSAIYINVDTDPATSTFRASAISRSPSRTRRPRRASSPRKTTDETMLSSVENKVVTSPERSQVAKKQSSRSLRSQMSLSRSLARHGLERVSPVSFSRPGSKHNPGLLSSDEDSEHGNFVAKRATPTRPSSKSSNKSRTSRRRKECAVVPQLPMTGQFAMEHVLMALAKCQNQGLDISLLSAVDVEKLAHQQKMEDELDSRAAKRLSVVQRPQRPFSGRFDDQSRLLKVKLKLPRPTSDLSVLTMTGTDTDTSTNRLSDGYSSLDKRGSAGSLTDPTDVEIYDMKPSIESIVSRGNTGSSRLIRSRRRPSSPTLSMKSFSYYQAQNNGRQATIPHRASRMLMAPPIAPPRTTSRLQTDPVGCSVSLASIVEPAKSGSMYNEIVDLDEVSTSDPFMLGMLDGMASWSNPVVNENVWRTWGDHDRVIEGKALFTPPSTAMNGVCVP